MEFDSFTRDVTKLLKEHKKCTTNLDFIKKTINKQNKNDENLEPFYSKTHS